MSNNYIPNSSAIPNVLFDYWMNILSPAEFKVLMCIARKTYGWHKNNDLISIKQIEKMTGLHRSGIVKNVDALVESLTNIQTISSSRKRMLFEAINKKREKTHSTRFSVYFKFRISGGAI